MNANFTIREVADRRALNDFLRVPFHVYADDPNWVAPLVFERQQALSPKHPFFEHATWRAWVAYVGATPVARISAQIDDLVRERHAQPSGHFGCFEAPDNPELAAALFARAEQWLAGNDFTRATGPFNLSINQELGLLVDGFDTPPYFMMPHGRPYYEELLLACGYTGVQDLLALLLEPDFPEPPLMRRLLRGLEGRLHTRPMDRSRVTEELEVLRDIFNDAWSENWGFIPFTENEFQALGRELINIVPAELVQIAEIDGEPAAFIVMMPNLNEAIADLHGRLLPFGWAKLLWRIKARFPSTARVPLMGVRKEYQNTRLGPGLAFAVIDAVRFRGYERGVRLVEMSWILESNQGMRSIIEAIGGRDSKRYRMFAKDLLPA